MKTIVFGGSGFLGSHVADALTAAGHAVTVFDLQRSRYLLSSQALIRGDILDQSAVQAAVHGAEVVYQFAGLADLNEANTKPLDTVKQNVVGTINILEASVQAGVRRFIYASTIYVYSNLGGFYRCSKQAGELYVEEYQRKYGLNFTVLRYGTLYGPRADYRNSVWSYLRQGLVEGKVIYPGTGEEIREYVHVRDAAKLSVQILSDEFANQHVIITGHSPMKARDMLNMISEMLNNNISIEFAGNAFDSHYSITPYSFIPKIGNKLVSNCYVDMGQGLLECLHDLSVEINGKKSRGHSSEQASDWSHRI